jgi:hypothetical protein
MGSLVWCVLPTQANYGLEWGTRCLSRTFTTEFTENTESVWGGADPFYLRAVFAVGAGPVDSRTISSGCMTISVG